MRYLYRLGKGLYVDWSSDHRLGWNLEVRRSEVGSYIPRSHAGLFLSLAIF